MKSQKSSIFLISFLISLVSILCFASDSKPTLIIFTADWCEHCHKVKYDIDNNQDLSEIIKKYQIVEADYDLDKDLVVGYNIKTIPAFVIIKENSVNKKFGYRGPKDLFDFLK